MNSLVRLFHSKCMHVLFLVFSIDRKYQYWFRLSSKSYQVLISTHPVFMIICHFNEKSISFNLQFFITEMIHFVFFEPSSHMPCQYFLNQDYSLFIEFFIKIITLLSNVNNLFSVVFFLILSLISPCNCIWPNLDIFKFMIPPQCYAGNPFLSRDEIFSIFFSYF